MQPGAPEQPEICNCLALRQATRHVSQYYDQFMAPTGLRGTQFSILAKLGLNGAMTINALAAALVMDRTTLGRNILPLERDGLLAIVQGSTDKRSKEVHLTPKGTERFKAARARWTEAQRGFDAAFGRERAAALRAILHDVVISPLEGGTAAE